MNLIKIESFSGNEIKIADFIISQLENFKINKQFIDKDRFNVIARKGKSRVWLLAHMDTVKGWVDPRESRNKIFGRGAVDNKGNIATAIKVGNELDNINLCFTIGEEEDFVGAKHAKKIIKNDMVIVMEPTDFEVYSSQRGVIIIEMRCKGKQGHSAYQNTNNNALHNLVDNLYKLKQQGWTSFNIGTIEGGIAPNVTAPFAKAIFSIRPQTMHEYKSILNTVKNYKIIKKIPSYKNKKISGKMRNGFTEMCFFKNSILFGVGKAEQAHSEKEYILKEDLLCAPEKLMLLIKNNANFQSL